MPADILIVDDTPANLRLLSQVLQGVGHRVRAVTSGARALAAIALARPDLILLDVRLPDTDGYALCARLKADPRLQDVPVIFISALAETEAKIGAFAAGGIDYVTKPLNPDEVLARPQAGNTNPYEVWKYTRGRPLKYVFWDQTQFGNYALIWTNDRREPSRPNWQELLGPEGVLDVERF